MRAVFITCRSSIAHHYVIMILDDDPGRLDSRDLGRGLGGDADANPTRQYWIPGGCRHPVRAGGNRAFDITTGGPNPPQSFRCDVKSAVCGGVATHARRNPVAARGPRATRALTPRLTHTLGARHRHTAHRHTRATPAQHEQRQQLLRVQTRSATVGRGAAQGRGGSGAGGGAVKVAAKGARLPGAAGAHGETGAVVCTQ